MLVAIVGPCIVVRTPSEIGRWKVAQAVRLRQAGQTQAAYDKLAAAMQWFPDSPYLLLQRAEWRLADGNRAEALSDCDQMLEVAGDQLTWLMRHSQFLWDTAEFERAVTDWKKINAQSQRTGRPAREAALNGLAYAQALAKVELEDALSNAEQALHLSPGNPAILDTRGYILHLLGRDEEALEDLDLAIKGMDRDVQQVRAALAALSKRGLAEGQADAGDVLKTVQKANGPSTLTEKYVSDARNAAVGHYHRAQALTALDRGDEAAAELAIAKELLGREPDETLY